LPTAGSYLGSLALHAWIIAHGGETITPPGSPAPIIENHVHIDRKSDLDRLIDVRIEKRTRTIVRTAGRGLPSRGGGQLR
jgi:hypothetical protein